MCLCLCRLFSLFFFPFLLKRPIHGLLRAVFHFVKFQTRNCTQEIFQKLSMLRKKWCVLAINNKRIGRKNCKLFRKLHWNERKKSANTSVKQQSDKKNTQMAIVSHFCVDIWKMDNRNWT